MSKEIAAKNYQTLLGEIKAAIVHSETQLKSNNFTNTLSVVHAEYTNQVFKDSYNLGFLGITEQVKETELEKRLVEKIKSLYWNWAKALRSWAINTASNTMAKNILDVGKPIGVAEYQLLLPKDKLQDLLVNEIKAANIQNDINT